MIDLDALLANARDAARELRALPRAKKDAVLLALAAKLKERESDVLAANAQDLAALPPAATAAFRDRLALSPARLSGMAESLRQVAALPDPNGEIVEEKTLASGVRARRMRSPLGVIFMIFESRPNVAVEAFSLAFKSSNAFISRGGKESAATCAKLYALMGDALRENGVAPAAIQGIVDPDRAIVASLLRRKDAIDVVVPRGGDRLIEFVTENSKIPVIKNDRGMCHVYVHADADVEMAAAIVRNAKTQRPGVCNSMETLLVHRSIAARAIPRIYDEITAAQLGTGPTAPPEASQAVEWHVDPATLALLSGRPQVRAATAESFDTEYLDLQMNCRVVDSLDEALRHIERHGSKHSEAILTRDASTAREFESRVDAAAVYWNASTRFTDGFELGLGGELGISTQKLHVRGPVGLRELTSVRWVLEGDGQIRE